MAIRWCILTGEAIGAIVNPVGPRGVYDEAKRFAEALTMAYRRAHQVDTESFESSTHTPPNAASGRRPSDPCTFIRQALRDEPMTVTGDGSQTRSVCCVSRNPIEGVVRLLESDLAGPVNMGNPTELSVLGLAEIVRCVVGSSSSITFVPRPQDDPSVRETGHRSCPSARLELRDLPPGRSRHLRRLVPVKHPEVPGLTRVNVQYTT